MGNCIGLRNLKKFLSFIISLFLHCITVSIYGIIQFIYLRKKNELWTYKEIIILVVMFFSVFTCLSLGCMIGQYVFLISYNKTTNENVRMTKYPGDVFDHGCKKNCEIFLKYK